MEVPQRYSPNVVEGVFSEVEHVQGQQEGPELLGSDPPGSVAFCYLATAPCTGVLTPALRPRKRSRPGPLRPPLRRPRLRGPAPSTRSLRPTFTFCEFLDFARRAFPGVHRCMERALLSLS